MDTSLRDRIEEAVAAVPMFSGRFDDLMVPEFRAMCNDITDWVVAELTRDCVIIERKRWERVRAVAVPGSTWINADMESQEFAIAEDTIIRAIRDLHPGDLDEEGGSIAPKPVLDTPTTLTGKRLVAWANEPKRGGS